VRRSGALIGRGLFQPDARGVASALIAAALCVIPGLASAQPAPNPDPQPSPPPEAAPPADGAAKPPADAASAGKDKPDAGKKESAPAASSKEEPPPADAKALAPPPKKEEPPPQAQNGFFFGSYGRMVSATDFHGRPGRDADIVARGSRLDESPYFELDVRRQDYWETTKSFTRVVATLGITSPVFHYTSDFTIRMAVRNLYLEERDLGLKGLSAWVGSRMYRGDDAYLLDFWPLDNLNTVGGGLRYDFNENRTFVAAHAGLNQPNTGFFKQTVQSSLPLNQVNGAASVDVLNRQKFIGSLKVGHVIMLGGDTGVKGALYGELHQTSAAQRETSKPGTYENLPADVGYVIGAQLGAFTSNATHLNLFIRYAGGMAAYGEFGSPYQLAPDKTSSGAHELWITASGNWERGPLGIMAAGYIRSFRDASPDLDFNDVDEGILIARPHLYFTDWMGLAVEGSYQAQQRGVSWAAGVPNVPVGSTIPASSGPLSASLVRFGLIPFFNPAGKGDYSRPQFRVIYLLTRRDAGARALYPTNDVFALRTWEHFFGVGVEWWFNAATTYGG
jgi:maltoporin